MAMQESVAVRTARVGSIPTTIGTSAKLLIITGTQPATCATAQSGSTIITLSLPSTYFNAASAGAITLTGSWAGTVSLAGTNTAGYFRLLDSTGTTCHMQGSCTLAGGGGDMILDSTSFTSGQSFSISAFTVTAGNA